MDFSAPEKLPQPNLPDPRKPGERRSEVWNYNLCDLIASHLFAVRATPLCRMKMEKEMLADCLSHKKRNITSSRPRLPGRPS